MQKRGGGGTEDSEFALKKEIKQYEKEIFQKSHQKTNNN
jgi:hypothetical protein